MADIDNFMVNIDVNSKSVSPGKITRIAILAYPGCMPAQIFGITDVLTLSQSLASKDNTALPQDCSISIIGISSLSIQLAGGHELRVKEPDGHYDLLIVPGLPATDSALLFAHLAKLKPEINFIQGCYDQHCRIASVCLGAFLLAEAGLVSGRKISTAWAFADIFASRYPDSVNHSHHVLVEDGSLISTGAVSSVFDLAMHLVEQIYGKACARLVGQITLLDSPRVSQLPYVNDELVRNLTPAFSRDVMLWLERHLSEPFDLARLANAFHISQRTLTRRIKNETGKSPLALLQRQRVNKAKELLSTTRLSLQSIVETVGYSDLPAFTRLFQRHVNESPANFRKRHS